MNIKKYNLSLHFFLNKDKMLIRHDSKKARLKHKKKKNMEKYTHYYTTGEGTHFCPDCVESKDAREKNDFEIKKTNGVFFYDGYELECLDNYYLPVEVEDGFLEEATEYRMCEQCGDALYDPEKFVVFPDGYSLSEKKKIAKGLFGQVVFFDEEMQAAERESI